MKLSVAVGDIYEDYDFYEDDYMNNYNEASEDQGEYGASQEKTPKKLNPSDKDESDKLGTYTENDEPQEYKDEIVNSFTGRSSENSGKEESSNKGPGGSVVASGHGGNNLLEKYETDNKGAKVSTSENKVTGKFSPEGGIDFGRC